ncbi:hypothetical protein V2J09_009686 [Rumex salicifolius]
MAMTKPVTVAVVYYLSRNSQLEHPHFMDVPLSSSQGLFLKDVIHRLNFLRGKGMANSYSWSAKRSYKNGYVWHDLEEEDLIHPVHGQDYVLKGSEILPEPSACSSVSKSSETASSDDERRLRSVKTQEELSREEISPPPTSDSSPETLESLMKADGKLVLLPSSSIQIVNRTNGGGKIKPPPQSILMSIVSCGSISFRNALNGRFPRGSNRAVESLIKDELPAFNTPHTT